MTEPEPRRAGGALIASALGVVVVLVGVAAAVAVGLRGDDGSPAAVPGGASSAPERVEAADGGLERPSGLAAANAGADLNVTVVAEQFSWIFNYTKGGSDQQQAVWELAPDGDVPTLWLVRGRSVTFGLYSPDVIHSFWLPDLLFKMDAVPGRAASTYFTVTPTELGEFTGRCAELCGEGHTRMLFTVKVVEQDAYDAHLAELANAGSTGLNVPAGYAEEISAS